MTLFPTQEIGSMAKPVWLTAVSRTGTVNAQQKAQAHAWGDRLEVEDRDELYALLDQEGDLKPHRKTLRRFATRYGIRLQEAAGLDHIYDGEARRIEMYESPIRQLEGLEFIGHIRSFDNKYYKKAVCTGYPKLRKTYLDVEWAQVKEEARKHPKVPLTGAYTLMDWSFDEYFTKAAQEQGLGLREARKQGRRELLMAFADEALLPMVKDLASKGADYIQIDEPAATTKPDEIGDFVESFNRSVTGVDAYYQIHFCFSDYSALYPHVQDLKGCNQFTWEFANRDEKHDLSPFQDLKLMAENSDDRDIGIGVLDVHSDVIESPELVRDRILEAAKVHGNPDKIWVNPDCGFRTRTWEVAYEKLVNMVKGTEMARVEYEGKA